MTKGLMMNLTPQSFKNPKAKRKGHFVRLGKINLYYETYGTGKPLLLFHGGLSCIDGLRYQIPFFAKYFKVILPERPGHGHTADVSGIYTYENLARLTVMFMDALKIRKAKMMGTSDGANLIYWLAAQRPDLVDRFISVGGNFHHRGCDSGFQRELKKQNSSKIKIDPRYKAYSPDGPKHYREVFEKCRKLWLTEPKWNPQLMKRIKAPGLIVAGDQDMISHEHSLELYRSLKKAQLAIIPGASHSLLKEKPEMINPMMLDFLKQKFIRV